MSVAVPPPAETAAGAGLVYVDDSGPGIRRRKRGRGFSYAGPDGRVVRDEAALARIAGLAIPPAWTNVWISPDPDGHLQATGRDARGRKQYRYHPRWREVRDATKFDRMIAFANALPAIRKRVDADLRRVGLPREKVLAAVVTLLETTYIRVGNEEYRRDNASYGLTTLRKRHVEIRSASFRFTFTGKGGTPHRVTVRNQRVARVVRRCEELPGYALFSYVDDEGAVRPVGSADVNAYLRETAGDDFTAKDFRTWWGSVHALSALLSCGPAEGKLAERNVVAAIDEVAQCLRNTRAVCRSFYVHPGVVAAYLDGTLFAVLARTSPRARRYLDVEEVRLLAVLQALKRRRRAA